MFKPTRPATGALQFFIAQALFNIIFVNPESTMTSRRTYGAAAAALIILTQLIVFAPALEHSFLRYDDNVYVYENKNVQSLDGQTISWMFARPFYHSYTPLALLSHAIDYGLWKNAPWGHHLSSLVLHAAVSLLVLFFARLLLSLAMQKEGWSLTAGAFIAAAMYSLHPMRVESVAWISDRKDLLLGLFLLPSIMAYVKYDRMRGTGSAIAWFLLALGFYVLALLSKSIATATPLLLLVLDGLVLHRGEMHKKWKTLVMEKIPFFILSIGFGILAMIAAQGGTLSDVVMRLTPTQRFLMPLYSLVFYPAKILWPVNLTPTYDSVGVEWMLLASLIAIAICVLVVVRAFRGKPLLLAVWLCYVLTILPTITGLSAGIQPWADRYSYVPSIALFVLLGGGVSLLLERYATRIPRLVVSVGLVVLTVVLAFLSRQQVSVWKDGETLWRYAAALSPNLPITYANLGVELESRGEHDSALMLYRKAIGLQPHYANALYNMGVLFEQRGLRDSAEYYYTEAILADTGYGDAYVNLGNILVTRGRVDEGIGLYNRASEIDPSDADPYYNLGYAYYQKGEKKSAIEFFKKATVYSPNYAQAYYNMGIIFVDLKDERAGIANLVRAARLGSPDAQTLLSAHGYSW